MTSLTFHFSYAIIIHVYIQWNLDYPSYLGEKGVHIIEWYVKSNIQSFAQLL